VRCFVVRRLASLIVVSLCTARRTRCTATSSSERPPLCEQF
jgi:hypothetical protein